MIYHFHVLLDIVVRFTYASFVTDFTAHPRLDRVNMNVSMNIFFIQQISFSIIVAINLTNLTNGARSRRIKIDKQTPTN